MNHTASIVSDLWLQHQPRPQKDLRINRRLSTPKVRTGCRVCKSSHLKCDEQKPSCGRCQKRGTTCHYQHRSTTRSSGTSTPPAAKNTHRSLLPAARTHDPTRARPSRIPASPAGTPIRPWEAQYFDSFRYLVVPHLHYHQSEFWCRTVLRESLHDECTRSAMLALGALGRVQEQQQRDVSVPLYKSQVDLLAKEGSTGRTVLNHYYQALVHYAKAISAFRRLLAGSAAPDNRHTPRSILIATVLLSQFELLQGNTDAADQIAARSVSLLCGRLVRGRDTPGNTTRTTTTTTTSTDREVDDMSLVAATIDDEGVCEAGTELILKTTLNAACSALCPKSREVVLSLDLPFTGGSALPRADDSLVVFVRLWKRCLAVVCVWYFRLQARMLAAQQQHREQQEGGTRTAGHDAFDVHPFVVAHRHEQRALLDLLTSWKAAVRARLASSSPSALDQPNSCSGTANPPQSGDYITYSKAAVEIYGSCYSVRVAFDISGKSWDDNDEASTSELLDQCEAVVDMVQEQIHRLGGGGGAAVHTALRDQGVIHDGAMPVVTQIAHQARHRGLRVRAMRLWGKMLGRDAHWDVLGTYLASQAVHDVEEEHRDEATGEIPLKRQYAWVEGGWDEGYKHFRAVVVAKVPGVDGTRDRRVIVVASPRRE